MNLAKAMSKWTLEQRFPTKVAREKADAAIDALTESEPMTTYIDTWLATYRAAGGLERRPK
jgi:hypothetical protein